MREVEHINVKELMGRWLYTYSSWCECYNDIGKIITRKQLYQEYLENGNMMTYSKCMHCQEIMWDLYQYCPGKYL